MTRAPSIAFPHPPGAGGPGSFQSRLETVLSNRGWQIFYADQPQSELADVALVVGGTKRFGWLRRVKNNGVPIVHRLDGLRWLHRTRGLLKEPRRWLSSEIRNAMTQWIHAGFASTVVYQSQFVLDLWHKQGWREPRQWKVIYNGIDLNHFKPDEEAEAVASNPDVVCVEGHIDYSPYAINLLNSFAKYTTKQGANLIVYGGFADPTRRHQMSSLIDYRGTVAREEVPGVYSNRIYLSLDVNPACPNAVAEALASGSPVIGFDTGAVDELVGENCGSIVSFGGDPWKGDWPQFASLNYAYDNVVSNFERISASARKRAEELFDINKIVDAYISIFEDNAR